MADPQVPPWIWPAGADSDTLALTVLENLLQQAAQARRENRLEEARCLLTEAVQAGREASAPGPLARALAGLGQIERDLHRPETAVQHYQQAATLFRAEQNLSRVAHTIRHVGDIHREEGRFSLAETCYQEALTLYRQSAGTHPLDLANTLRGLALLQSKAAQASAARPLWQEARHLYAACNVGEGVAESTRQLALLERAEQ